MGQYAYTCPLCGGRHFLEIGGAALAPLETVMNLLQSKHATEVMRLGGHKVPRGTVMKVRDLKKLSKRLMNRGQMRDDVGCKMIGILILHHSDGKKSKFLAQSGGESLDLTDMEGGYYVARSGLAPKATQLPRLFGGGTVTDNELDLELNDFRVNCAPMKMFITAGRALANVAKGGGKGILASTAPVADFTMAEQVYRPFTKRHLDPEWRQWTRGDFGDPNTSHLAVSCPRCQQKIPSLLCPVAAIRKNKLKIFASAEKLVASWTREYHSEPWGRGFKIEVVEDQLSPYFDE